MRLLLKVLFLNLCVLSAMISSFSNIYNEICGKSNWHHDFLSNQKAILNGDMNPKFVVAIPTYFGLADVILGYVSAFLLALLHKSAFAIIKQAQPFFDNSQRNIEYAYNFPIYNWSGSLSIYESLYSCMLPPYYPYEKRIPCNDSYVFYDKITHSLQSISRLPSSNSSQNISKLKVHNFHNVDRALPVDLFRNETDIALVTSNRGITYDMFDVSIFNETLQEYGFTRENVFPCIFNFLFQVKENVCDGGCIETVRILLNQTSSVYNFSYNSMNTESDINSRWNSSIRIGIQIRYENQADAHFYCLDDLLNYFKKRYVRVIILLITSSVNLQKKAKVKYTDHSARILNIIPTRQLLLPEGHPASITPVHDRTHKMSVEEAKALDEKAMKDSARDFYLLSLTDIQIISSLSGFGTVGSMTKLRKRPVIFGMDSKGRKMKRCGDMLPNGDPLSYFAHTWSGL